MSVDKCRFCDVDLKYTFADLGLQPLANEYLSYENSRKGQSFYPLHIKVCSSCFLVQMVRHFNPEHIFTDYKYFSSNSKAWLKHAENYVGMIKETLNLNKDSLVAEIASNDGYLLQYFNKAGVRNFGIEPAANVAEVAKTKGIDVICDFFGKQTALRTVHSEYGEKYGKVDLLIGNNVLAHVPDINDFVAGMKVILKDSGTVTMEFPHLLNLIDKKQFDTIYHEHFSYLSLFTVINIFEKHGLKVYDVEQIETHGGSLRVYATHIENNTKIMQAVENVLNDEIKGGLKKTDTYTAFQQEVNTIKYNSIIEMSKLRLAGKTLLAYGAAAKGNTFLNFCGLGKEYFEHMIDVTPEKQGLCLPGTLIPIVGEDYISKIKPDYIAILPWNWKDEIIGRLNFVREWGCKFIIFIPELSIFD